MKATARIRAPLWRRVLAWFKQPLGLSARCPVCKGVLRGPDMAYSRNGDCWDETCKGSMWARQRRSFAYGNTKISNDSITREMIDEADE